MKNYFKNIKLKNNFDFNLILNKSKEFLFDNKIKIKNSNQYILEYFENYLPFNISNIDEKFDYFSINNNLFQNIEPILRFIISDQVISVNLWKDNNKNEFTSNLINENSLLCLELGIINTKFYEDFLQKNLKNNNSKKYWKNGIILVQIYDNRNKNENIFYQFLKLTSNLFSKLYKENENLDHFKIIYPQICIDPSPNVSRYQSICDFKEKN